MTIKEIAKLAGVSLGTVDRVIHKRGKVSEKTKKKILKILEEVNYKPNLNARALVLNKTFSIIALLPSYKKGEYWEMPAKGVLQAAEDYSQFGLKLEVIYFDQNISESFIEKAKEVVAKKPDGVILAPVINFEALKLSIKLKELHIPFSIVDSNMPNSNPLSFTGQDAYQSGKLGAKLLATSIKNKGTIAIVSIKSNENYNQKLQQRIEGFKAYFFESTAIQHINLTEFYIDQRVDKWKDTLKEACSQTDLVGLFVPSSKVHHAAKITVDLNREVSVVGYDLIDKNLTYLKKGAINYLIGQRPENQGYTAFTNFYRHLISKQDFLKEKYIPLDIVTQENIMYYDVEVPQIV